MLQRETGTSLVFSRPRERVPRRVASGAPRAINCHSWQTGHARKKIPSYHEISSHRLCLSVILLPRTSFLTWANKRWTALKSFVRRKLREITIKSSSTFLFIRMAWQSASLYSTTSGSGRSQDRWFSSSLANLFRMPVDVFLWTFPFVHLTHPVFPEECVLLHEDLKHQLACC